MDTKTGRSRSAKSGGSATLKEPCNLSNIFAFCNKKPFAREDIAGYNINILKVLQCQLQ